MPTHCTITRVGFHAMRIDGVEYGLFFESRTAWADHITYGTSICYSVLEKVEVSVTVYVSVRVV